MLGKDADRHEYWHFKEDAERIYVRFDEPVLSSPDARTGISEVLDHRFTWFYIEDEDKYEQLVESLNPKGVREKKLQENLKRIKNHLKLKRTRKALEKPEKLDASMEAKQLVIDLEMSEQNATSPANVEMEESEQHIVF